MTKMLHAVVDLQQGQERHAILQLDRRVADSLEPFALDGREHALRRRLGVGNVLFLQLGPDREYAHRTSLLSGRS
jgi:hypothetical protein